MAVIPKERRSLLSSQARLQAPWIKITIGTYTFGVFGKKGVDKDDQGNYKSYNVQYPSYVQSLNITKINGQVNQYSLQLTYPVRPQDDPNLIEKILSSVTMTRKIVFSYGDATNPAYIYKDEEAIITKVTNQFNLESSTIQYTINAVSGAALAASGSFTFTHSGPIKPSDEIKRVLKDTTYGLQNIFKGMNDTNIDALIDGSDAEVEVTSKTNISPLDYITYLVGCMIPDGASVDMLSKDIYVMTIHDETVYDSYFNTNTNNYYFDHANTATGGPYFQVTRVAAGSAHRADAYEIDVGINTSTIVLGFTIDHNENYSMLYEYNSNLITEQFANRINDKGEWEQVYAPMYTSGNNMYVTGPEDRVWYTKLTKYPISATIKIQGLLRPANLLQYVRLNVVFPGGNSHISSGLYIVTKQVDDIGSSGYFTTLSLTRLSD